MARRSRPFAILDAVEGAAAGKLRDGDVLVVSSKFVAISEGRVIRLDSVVPSAGAKELASRYRIAAELCELIIRESDEVLGGVTGFILTLRDGLLTPNAGIDKSNVEHGKVVLYPRNSSESASKIVDGIKFRQGIDIGVVISDSRLMPTRRGTTGVALAAAGLEAVLDLRGRVDLFGNILRVTSQAIADDLCSAAQLVMGEASEATPIVLVRGISRSLFKETVYPTSSFSVRPDQCVYMRSLGFSSRRKIPRAS
jgi:coenzyme F420-0:L-glutamate ligase / coenzyme F420-1:gamma-L-glutamate ligase